MLESRSQNPYVSFRAELQDKLRDTLDDLVQHGVISKVTKPTAWVNILVITEKRNGTLRVCLEYQDPNKAVKRQHFTIPTPEDVQCRLADDMIIAAATKEEHDNILKLVMDSLRMQRKLQSANRFF
ncbi:hypothetical protein SKAU_G00021420 [Synaphobranchus kaupii]|uniref:Uncharacterized protein n=1 Tax=Synaphobranchus kaupii TaxID=118154 RepID=A0A9Q1GBY0_SYNKA|nr:hypothetical protein SKAU_G00021420 [Synaphobranchus kaupii]